MEVQKETYFQSAQPQVREELGAVNRQELLDGLQFDKHLVIDNQVYSISYLDPFTSVEHWQGNLLLKF